MLTIQETHDLFVAAGAAYHSHDEATRIKILRRINEHVLKDYEQSQEAKAVSSFVWSWNPRGGGWTDFQPADQVSLTSFSQICRPFLGKIIPPFDWVSHKPCLGFTWFPSDFDYFHFLFSVLFLFLFSSSVND